MKIKKITSVLLAGMVLAAAVPLNEEIIPDFSITASASEEVVSGTCGENLTWVLNSEGTLTISGEGDMTDWTYLYSAPWDLYDRKIAEVVINYGVTSIGNYAFYDCTSTTSITISDSVTNIGESAFDNCVKLTSITIPDSVTNIGEQAFYHCVNLTSVTISDSVTNIGKQAFYNCINLTSITIPDSVTSIGDYAFYSCDSLTSITIPDSVTSIGSEAFYHCNSLTAIDVDAENEYYASEDGVFFNKDKTTLIQYPIGNKVTEYVIPDSVKSIEYGAFASCDSLTSITIPDSVTSIGSNAFSSCTSVTSITIPDSVTSIGISAFNSCKSLTSITIENPECEIYDYKYTIISGATIYGYQGSTAQVYAKYYDREFVIIGDTPAGPEEIASGTCGENLTWVIDLEGTLTISGESDMADWENGESPWYDYKKYITEVVINDGVTSIGSFAFNFLDSVTSIEISDSVTSIGKEAFGFCKSLTSITFPASVTSIADDIFSLCYDLKAINVDENNEYYASEDGVFFNKDKTTLIQYPIGNEATEYVIPDSVTIIEDNAFQYCESLTSITIPDSVISIEDFAFDGCENITSVIIPDSVTSIGDFAFSGCSSLTTVSLSKSVTSIGSYPFSTCRNLKAINVDTENEYYSSENGVLFNKDKTILIKYPNAREAEEYVIPDGVITIAYHSFDSSYNLISVTIPDSVTIIEKGAFEYCDGITSIIIPAGVISIAGDVFYSCDGLESITIENPGCEIYNYKNTIDSGATIYGYEGSTAQTYAEKYDREFIVLGEAPEVPKVASGTCGENVTWVLDRNGLLTISGEGNMADWESLYDVPWYDYIETITKLVIDSGVTSIGANAFSSLASLNSVTISDTVTSIGTDAFNSCIELRTITIPDSVTSIGSGAFNWCNYLTGIIIPDSVTSIGADAFRSCYLKSITIPESVTIIGNGAFVDCKGLAEINVDEKNKNYSSEDGVLFNKDKTILIQYSPAKNADTYVIPDSVTSIGNNAFANAHSLISITIPDSVTSIGSKAFASCFYLASITIPDSITSIEGGAFYFCTSLTSVIIPDNVTIIEEDAFKYCSSLTSITIPESVTSIGDEAFYNCSSLESITIENPECEIYDYEYTIYSGATIYGYEGSTAQAYAEKYDREFVSLGDAPAGSEDIASGTCGENIAWVLDSEGTLTISGEGDMNDWLSEESPWYNNETITKIVIEDGITNIGENAFASCISLNSVIIPDSVASIGDYAFLWCDSLTAIDVDDKNEYFTSEDGVLFNKDKTTLIQYPIGKDAEEYVIPDSVTSIGEWAFTSCDSLTSLIIPDGVTSIGNNAFFYCGNLTSITIPESVKSIGSSVFLFCDSLTAINVDAENENYASEDDVLFNKDKTTLIQYPAGKVATEYVMPDSVTNIGEWAFYNCSSLTSITVPESVTSIGDFAFYCCEGLTSITIKNPECEIEDSESAVSPTATIYGHEGSTAQAYAEKYDREFVALGDAPAGSEDIASGTCGENIAWVLNSEGVLTISGEGELAGWENLTDVPWYDYKDVITSIIIDESVTSVGRYTLSVTGVTSITIKNPECEIEDSESAVSPTATIYGYEGSTAQAYAEKYDREFVSLGGESVSVMLGDVDGDGTVSASDASKVLRNYAITSTGGVSEFDENQTIAADVNKDGAVDSSDASKILAYYAYTSTGGKNSLEDFMKN